MSNPPNDFNTNTTFNKYKGSYFNDDVDVSGGDIINRTGNLYLADNSSIYTSTNQIQFDDTYSFTNFLNSVNIFGQLKLTYNSIEYDVGLQCEKTDNLIDDVATLSPIASDTAFKCTNFYYDQASNSTVWSGLLTCPPASITSSAIANTTRFIEGTGNQTVGGIKTFTTAPVMDGTSINVGSIPIAKVSGTAVNLSTAQSITGTKTYTVVQNFSNNIRLDGSLLLSLGTITITNATLQKLQYISTISSDIQTQLNTTNSNVTTLTNNSVSLSALNTFSGATNTFTNNIRLDSSLLLNAGALTITNANLQKLQYISTISSDIQTQVTNLSTSSVSLSALNSFSGATNTFTNNIRLDGSLIVNNNATTLTNATLNKIQYLTDVTSNVNTSISNLNTKTTKMSYMSVGGINTTTITDGLISQTFSFTNSINNISTTTFGYLSGVTSSIQAQINNFSGVSLSANNSFTGSNTFANITFSGTLNSISNSTFAFLSGATENLQTAINALKTKTDTTNINLATTTTSANEAKQRTTDIEFSDIGGNQTTISNKCVLGEVQFNTDLNDITPTTFGYLQGVSSPIQTQIDSKTRIPTGTIIMSVGDSLQNSQPLIWLKCNGQAVSRTTYLDLYQYILSRYGDGDGSTTFNVPNFQACFLRGGMYFPETERVVNGVTYTPNGPLTIQQDSLEAHVHSSNLSGNYLRSGTTSNTSDAFLIGPARPNRSDFPAFGGGVSSSHRTSPETRPLNHSIFYYIKT